MSDFTWELSWAEQYASTADARSKRILTEVLYKKRRDLILLIKGEAKEGRREMYAVFKDDLKRARKTAHLLVDTL
jgi:hypothetical protein